MCVVVDWECGDVQGVAKTRSKFEAARDERRAVYATAFESSGPESATTRDWTTTLTSPFTVDLPTCTSTSGLESTTELPEPISINPTSRMDVLTAFTRPIGDARLHGPRARHWLQIELHSAGE